MAAKSAKDVVLDTLRIEMVDNYNCLSCGHHQPESLGSKALRVVASLDKAGWLRATQKTTAFCCPVCREADDGLNERIAELARERDKARKGREYWLAENKKLTQHYDGALERLRASAASPEVMRVLDATSGVFTQLSRPDAGAKLGLAGLVWWDACNALSASRQPKAQEPRYVAEGCEVWDTVQRQADGSRRLLCRFYGIAACGAAQEHAARLNGEGGGK